MSRLVNILVLPAFTILGLVVGSSGSDISDLNVCFPGKSQPCCAGWTTRTPGGPCNKPICRPRCIGGSCVAPNTCLCADGRRAQRCDISAHTRLNCAQIRCNHRCIKRRGRVECACKIGFRLARDGKTCVDVNECVVARPCEHGCQNTRGNYMCYCYPGYVLQTDGRSCRKLSSYDEIRGIEDVPFTYDESALGQEPSSKREPALRHETAPSRESTKSRLSPLGRKPTPRRQATPRRNSNLRSVSDQLLSDEPVSESLDEIEDDWQGYETWLSRVQHRRARNLQKEAKKDTTESVKMPSSSDHLYGKAGENDASSLFKSTDRQMIKQGIIQEQKTMRHGYDKSSVDAEWTDLRRPDKKAPLKPVNVGTIRQRVTPKRQTLIRRQPTILRRNNQEFDRVPYTNAHRGRISQAYQQNYAQSRLISNPQYSSSWSVGAFRQRQPTAAFNRRNQFRQFRQPITRNSYVLNERPVSLHANGRRVINPPLNQIHRGRFQASPTDYNSHFNMKSYTAPVNYRSPPQWQADQPISDIGTSNWPWKVNRPPINPYNMQGTANEPCLNEGCGLTLPFEGAPINEPCLNEGCGYPVQGIIHNQPCLSGDCGQTQPFNAGFNANSEPCLNEGCGQAIPFDPKSQPCTNEGCVQPQEPPFNLGFISNNHGAYPQGGYIQQVNEPCLNEGCGTASHVGVIPDSQPFNPVGIPHINEPCLNEGCGQPQPFNPIGIPTNNEPCLNAGCRQPQQFNPVGIPTNNKPCLNEGCGQPQPFNPVGIPTNNEPCFNEGCEQTQPFHAVGAPINEPCLNEGCIQQPNFDYNSEPCLNEGCGQPIHSAPGFIPGNAPCLNEGCGQQTFIPASGPDNQPCLNEGCGQPYPSAFTDSEPCLGDGCEFVMPLNSRDINEPCTNEGCGISPPVGGVDTGAPCVTDDCTLPSQGFDQNAMVQQPCVDEGCIIESPCDSEPCFPEPPCMTEDCIIGKPIGGALVNAPGVTPNLEGQPCPTDQVWINAGNGFGSCKLLTDYMETLVDGCSPTNQGPLACNLMAPPPATMPIQSPGSAVNQQRPPFQSPGGAFDQQRPPFQSPGGTASQPHPAFPQPNEREDQSRLQFIPPDEVRIGERDDSDSIGGKDEIQKEVDRKNFDSDKDGSREEKPAGRIVRPVIIRREKPKRREKPCEPGCTNGGSCINNKCVCPRGFTGDYCQADVDECARLPDNYCEYKCANSFGSYQCVCRAGSTLNADGRTCSQNRCVPTCMNGGTCLNGQCVCPVAYTGRACESDVDECSQRKGLCQHRCRNTFGSYECTCPSGSRLNDDQRTCSSITCTPECQNGGSCVNNKCVCQKGYRGVSCQLDVNECRAEHLPCQHKCINTFGSFRCACPVDSALQEDGVTCQPSGVPSRRPSPSLPPAKPALNRADVAPRQLRIPRQRKRIARRQWSAENSRN